MVIYIPKSETLDSWSEIITVETIPHYPAMLEFYLRKHKIAIEMLFTSTELRRSEIKMCDENGTQVGYAHYRTPHYVVKSQEVDENFMECMGMKLLQGEDDLYRVAYNIKYPPSDSHEPIEEKIHHLLESCAILHP